MENYIGKVCPFCKTDIRDGDAVKVCPSCGVPHHERCWEENKGCTTLGCSEQHFEAQSTNPTNVCYKCGTALGEDQMFCPKCGTPKMAAKKNICVKCGAELQDGHEFCPKCGQKIGLVADTGVGSIIPHPNSGSSKSSDKKKKSLLLGISAIALIVVCALVIAPALLKSTDDYLALGNYEKAYSVARGERKDDVLFENLIAFVSKDVPDGLKDPSSFSLRDAWYDSENQRIVLSVNGANSYGATVSNYWHYTYDEDDAEYSLFVSLSDLDEEETYSWDDTYEILEKAIKNRARTTVKDIIGNKSMKLDKDCIKNINNLFEQGLLEDVELLEENK